jgi:hypothetical protein
MDFDSSHQATRQCGEPKSQRKNPIKATDFHCLPRAALPETHNACLITPRL